MSNNPLRKIGDTGVPALGYGAMGLAAFYNTLTKQEDADKVFDLLLSKGVTHWDTSDIYSTRPSLGEGEEQIGAYFASHPEARSKVFLATKHGFVIHDDGSRGVQAGKEYALKACAASLKRLNTDHVDLYYQHRALEPIEETFEGLKQLQKEGKIKHIGVSEYNLEQLERANKVAHIDAIQIEFSPWTPDILSNGVLDWAKNNKTAIVAYSPLGRGFLSGAIKSPDDLSDSDFRKANPRFQGENFNKNLELVEQLKKIADRKSAKPGQIALAWLLAQADNVHVIPGSTKQANILENIGALDVKLSSEDLKEISGIVDSFKVQGDRYDGPMKHLVHF